MSLLPWLPWRRRYHTAIFAPGIAVALSISVTSPSLLADPLKEFKGCVLKPTSWADGDSFLVRFPSGKEHTVRLYGADCVEWHVTDATDERRLREQRRYFGISKVGGSPRASIELAKGFGALAGSEVATLLKGPFTVHTAFADGGGDGRYKRIYGFILTAAGKDLASLLVEKGLARAYGVYRQSPDGRTREDYRAQLQDLELRAAKRGLGVWSKTDWDALLKERKEQRDDDAEVKIAIGKAPLDENAQLNPNTAARDELMRLPGIGETLANRIIEGRPYRKIDDLLGVNGIGPASIEKMKPFLKFSAP